MSMKQQCGFFDVDVVSQHIKVQKPYFAFHQLWRDGELLVGSFSSEQPLLYEAGPVAAGELGRHLAILGSCAAVALHEGSEAYYLATKAHFTRKHADPTSETNMLYASAQVLSIEKRALRISAKAWGNKPLAELFCEYVILPTSSFKRYFKHYACEDFSTPSNSPYRQSIPLHSHVFHEAGLDVSAGPLSPQQCAGHFSSYPCWPVAIISQTAFEVAGELLKKLYGEHTRFQVQDTKLSAEKLVGAATVLRFRTEVSSTSSTSVESITLVYRDDEEVAKLKSILSLIQPV